MNPNNLNSKEVLETQISEIQATSTPKSSVVVEEPKSSKGWKIATICAAVLAVAGVSFGVFEMLNSNKNSNANIESQLASSGLAIEKGEIIVVDKNLANALVADNSDAEVQNLIDELEPEVSKDLEMWFWKVWDSYGPSVKKEGSNVRVYLDKSYKLAFRNLNESTPLNTEEKISEQLKKRGFEKEADLPFEEVSYINKQSGILCVVTASSSPLSCGHLAWLTDEDVALANELAEAFYKKENQRIDSIKLGEIKDSITAPYQIMRAGVSNGYGLFYRTSPDAEWQFFKGGQDALSCSDYDTEDVRKAFAGDKCYKEDVTVITEDSYDTVQP